MTVDQPQEVLPWQVECSWRDGVERMSSTLPQLETDGQRAAHALVLMIAWERKSYLIEDIPTARDVVMISSRQLNHLERELGKVSAVIRREIIGRNALDATAYAVVRLLPEEAEFIKEFLAIKGYDVDWLKPPDRLLQPIDHTDGRVNRTIAVKILESKLSAVSREN